jgi:hypothetical protein
MARYAPKRILAPAVFISGNVQQQNTSLTYSETGLLIRAKKTDEVILDASWSSVRRVIIVRNHQTLGIVHLLLILVFWGSIIGAIFLPHIVMHLLYNITIKWAGFIEIELKSGHIVQMTPAGWTRLGFHISESQLMFDSITGYTKLPDIELIDYEDYHARN